MRIRLRRLRKPLLIGGALFLLFGVLLILWTSARLEAVFEARERQITSRLLGRTYALERGALGTAPALAERLSRLGYERVSGSAEEPGTYSLWRDRIQVHLRHFRDPSGEHPPMVVRVEFTDGLISWVDREGGYVEPDTIAHFHGPVMEERDVVEVDDCPEHLIAAILAAEDRRFYVHPGVDPRGIARALWANISSGSILQGGSTLTQQLVKNLYFTSERSFARKGAEAFAAMILEARYPKERILRAYLNEIYLGQRGPASVRGVARAARHYFGKKVADLSLAESALLAGMIRAPGNHNPFLHPDRARERRRIVLRSMHESGAITEEERFAAERAPLPERPPEASAPERRGAYVADLIRQDLEAAHGAEFREQDLRVHTSLDPIYQEAAEEAVKAGLEDLERRFRWLRKEKEAEPLQAALVSIDLRSGGILAMVGGRGFASSQFNRVTSARRQPGSLFKPVVYLAGLTGPDGSLRPKEERRSPPRKDRNDEEEYVRAPPAGLSDAILLASFSGPGIDRVEPAKKRRKRRWWWPTPRREEPEEEEDTEAYETPSIPLSSASILQDEPYELLTGGKTWAPRNWDNTFRGPVTVQRALEESLNVPTARAAALIGTERIVETGRALGIESPLPEVPSLALGTANVTPLEMATAFATIASEGTRRQSHILEGVTNSRTVLHQAGLPRPASRVEPSSDGGLATGTIRDIRWSVNEKGEQAVPRLAAQVMTALLQGVTHHGTAKSIRRLGFEGVAAGKTGTSDGGRDLWFCGYTPQVVTLVWVGFDDNTPTHLSGAKAALPIWVDYMKRIGADTRERFPGDEEIAWAAIDPATGELARRTCPKARWAPFVPGTEPVEPCRRHGRFWGWWRE
jgi:membrane peptidoglycan carboxypeptidase